MPGEVWLSGEGRCNWHLVSTHQGYCLMEETCELPLANSFHFGFAVQIVDLESVNSVGLFWSFMFKHNLGNPT